MKKIPACLFLIATICCHYGSASAETCTSNTCNNVAVLNGKTIVEQLVEKFAASQEDDHAIARFRDSVSWLQGKRVIIKGHVGEVSNRFFSKGKKVIVTVGRSNEQAVNVKFLLREGTLKSDADLQVGQDIVFDGKISSSWDFFNDLVVDDAFPVDFAHYRRMVRDAEAKRDSLLGDCLIKELPFDKLDRCRKFELHDMAKCANAAYPDNPLPPGYRPLSREEWNSATAHLPYSADIYSDNGYIVFGDGLRGRVFVSRFFGRAVVAWSGCDLSGDKIRLAGGLDFMTCFSHLLKGDTSSQFAQALAITKAMAAYFQDEIWVVGHSLGGCITTYVASAMEETSHSERLKFATFNGLGISTSIAKSLSSERRNACAQRLTNVYSTEDPVYNMHRMLRWAGIPPWHLGRSYFMEYRIPAEGLGNVDESLWHHSMDEMCFQIQQHCPWYQNHLIHLIATFSVAAVLGIWILVMTVRRVRAKSRCRSAHDV